LDDELLFRAIIGEVTSVEQRAVDAWRRSAASNEERYRQLAAILQLVSAAESPNPPAPVPRPWDVIERAGARGAAPAPRRSLGLRWPTVAVAGLVAASLAALAVALQRSAGQAMPRSPLGLRQLATGPTDGATIRLDDGSIVGIGPSSVLRVGGSGREVFLAGRASFDVAQVEGQPFWVRTDAGGAVALGTEFVVRATDRAMVVVVFGGRVDIANGPDTVRVRAGEIGSVANGRASVARVEGKHTAGEWLHAALVFQAMPLQEVLAIIGRRYHISVEITDSVSARRRVTAWFIDDPGASHILQAVCRAADARCSITDSSTSVGRRGG